MDVTGHMSCSTEIGYMHSFKYFYWAVCTRLDSSRPTFAWQVFEEHAGVHIPQILCTCSAYVMPVDVILDLL